MPRCVSGLFYRLDESDILGTWPFGAAPLFILHLLPFAEGFKGGALQCGLVEEYLSLRSRNEPKSPVYQLLDRTLWHFPLQTKEIKTYTAVDGF